jgi:hypothetical protein
MFLVFGFWSLVFCFEPENLPFAIAHSQKLFIPSGSFFFSKKSYLIILKTLPYD